MANITYTNLLANNPLLEAMLDAGGTIVAANATTFEIRDNVAGPFQNFIFRLTGSGFTFGGPGGAPDGGAITGFTVLDNAAHVVATATSGAFGFGDSSLAHFWEHLQLLSARAALDELLFQSDVITGDSSADTLRPYGVFSPDTLIGGGGDDTFVVLGIFLTSHSVHGSAEDGSGGDTENDVLRIAGNVSNLFSAVTDIDELNFDNSFFFLTDFVVRFRTDQIGPGLLSSTLAVTGNPTTATANVIEITRGGSSAVDLDLSGWTFVNWGSDSQFILTDLNDSLATDDHVIGSSGRDTISAGSGDDTLDGNGGVDALNGGSGNDVLISGLVALGGTLDGGGDLDLAIVDRSNRTQSFTLDLADPSAASNVGDGTSIVRVERVEFHAGSGNDHLVGGALADILIGNGGSDFLAGGGGDDDLQGGNGIDTLSGDAGNDNLAGGAGNDNLDGGDNDDILNGGTGFDTLDGGDGTDRAVFSGVRAAYTITPLGNDFQVTGPDGTDFLTNIEFAQFADITIALEPGYHFFGTPGDDSFTALAGSGRIDALGGIDTIKFNFRLVDATISFVGNQVIVDSAASHTVLTGFEIYVFADGVANNNDGDPLVDDLFYAAQYHDVWNAQVDADQHYHQFGRHEGRDPSAFFDTDFYLSVYPDVKNSGTDPLLQHNQSGWKDGRAPSAAFDGARYLQANPDVAAAHVDPLAHFLLFGAQEGRQPFALGELIAPNGFDYVYYLQHNPDVAGAHVDPFAHFETVGWKEGRNPNALFDTAGYLATYADVKAADINPLDHYNSSGWHEGRDPSVGFDTTAYLAAYADIAAAKVNPLVHFLDFGIHEGRSPFADGVWG